MITKSERWSATGKRKTAVARVCLTPGTGKIYIRKWRLLKKGTHKTVSIQNRKGEKVEVPIFFSDKVKDGQFAVPRTQQEGKKPFTYTPFEEYFGRDNLRLVVQQPFEQTKTVGQFDVWINVRGGGLSGQADAVRHGISNALLRYEQEKLAKSYTSATAAPAEDSNASLPIRRALKKVGFLTRDSRVKERKKYGRAAARKRFQYSKR